MTETDNGVIITVDNKNGATTAFIKNGEKGEQGIQGKTGEKGDKGDKGEDGTGVTILGSFDTEEELKLAHPTGEIGHSYLVAGSLYVWSTTENDWVNVGNIQGPKGDKGDIGETGPKGETGKDGAPGKSAYEYAKEAGYTETESDFAQKLAAENYTKNEVDDLITSSIAKANHLQRTIVQSSLSIDPNAEGAENFIYMVPKSDSLSEDHYDEFMVIDGKVEKVGDWDVNLDEYATEEYVDKIVSTIDTDASLLVLVDISTMTANYSKTEIINASKSGKVVYADVSNQLFILKNALNASFAEMSYLTGGTKIDLTSFYIDDEKKVHLNVSDTFNLLPNYSTSDYGKYVTPSTNGLVYRELPNPVQSVNNKTGAVILTASDVGARPSTWMPSASDVGALPDNTVIPAKVSQLENDKGYLTEHQDISGKLEASALPTAINTALAQAKASGEFDGKDGANGKDGTSATHSWNGTVLTITSASGTSSADLKGDKGDKGDTGATGSAGKDGKTPVKGVDYFTDADKAEIAEQIEGATLVQAPTYVNSVEKMTNTEKVYVLAETGHIWVYMDTTAMQTVTDDVDADYEYPADSRLGSDGSAQTSGSYAGYTITPFIDLLAYPVPFTLHMEGMAITSANSDSYTRTMVYDESQTKLSGGNTIVGAIDNFLNVSDSNVTVAADGSTTILFTTPPKGVNAGTILDNARYARFSGKITATPKVYVTYETEVTGGQWIDTGTTYAPTLTEADKQSMVDEVASMVDVQLLSMIGDGAVTV